jgi:hypothetical protein
MTGHRSFIPSIPSNRHTARQTFRAAVLFSELYTKVGTVMVSKTAAGITNTFMITVESRAV